MKHSRARTLRSAVPVLGLVAIAALVLASCSQSESVATTASAAPAAVPAPPPGSEISPTKEFDLPGPEEEYGEYLADPKELVSVPTNDIVKSLRFDRIAMAMGRKVYGQQCASWHGEDLKGIPAARTPDLTDNVWRFSGDDFISGGMTQYPSDVEWTVRWGIRVDNPNTRGFEVDMLAYDPQYRNKHDLEDFGIIKTVTPEEIDFLSEYVLQLGKQKFDRAKAAKGKVLFLDNAKGNCFDCHGEDGTGITAFGSTDLTKPKLYLYGTDKASIVESTTKGRTGQMPSFDGKLTPEEIKAVSVYVFSRAAKQ